MSLQELETVLSEKILSGEYPAGDKLPPIRRLVQDLDSSYVTVQKVIKELEKKGLLKIVPGHGAFVTDMGTGKRIQSMGAKEILYLFDEPDAIAPEEYGLELYRHFQELARENGFLDRMVVHEGLKRGKAELSKVAGVITTHYCSTARKLYDDNYPVVYCTSIPIEGSIPSVTPDFYAGARLVTEHLIKSGKKKILFINTSNLDIHAQNSFLCRYRGYTDAMEDAGLSELPPVAWHFRNETEQLKEIVTQKNKPEALMVANDKMAVEVLDFLHNLGIRVPEDISVGGLEDMSCSRNSRPPLTTAAYDRSELMKATFNMLLELMDGKISGSPRRTIPMRLIKRDSVKAR